MTTTDPGLPEELEARVYEIFFDLEESKEAAFAELLDENPDDRERLRLLWQQLVGGADALIAEPIEVQDPSELGPYRILRRLGVGGFGVVYLAEQREPISRRVAIKQLLVGLESERVLRRFHAERRALARMSHPCIAMAIDAGASADGRPYLVMEYVDGQPIDDYCDTERLTVRERLEIFLEVLDGVQHAHHKAILHRDLKPTNILVTSVEGRALPKIIDFGIARLFEDDETSDLPVERTLEGHFVGTPEFVSPEQAAGKSSALDTRCDVYALGVVLYRVLTGTLPFARDELMESGLAGIADALRRRSITVVSQRVRSLESERAEQIAASRATTTRELQRRLRGDLDGIVRKAMEFEPSRRYASAAEFASDLRNHLAALPISARPPSRLDELVRFVRRQKVAVAAAAIVFVTLSVSSVVSSMLYADAVRAREGVELREYESAIALADHAIREQNAVAAAARLEACDPRFRGFAWRHLTQRLGRSTLLARFDTKAYCLPAAHTPAGNVLVPAMLERGTICASFAPDGSERWRRKFETRGAAACREYFALTTASGRTTLFDSDSGEEVGVVPNPPGSRVFAISEDGRELMFLGGATLTLVDRETHEVICSTRARTNRYPMRASTDARSILVHRESRIRQHFHPRGALLYVLGEEGAREYEVDIPDFVACGAMLSEQRLAVGTGRGVSVVDLESGRVVREFAANGGGRVESVRKLGIDEVITGGVDTAVEIWNWRTGTRRTAFLGSRRSVTSLEANRDGTSILAVSSYEGVLQIDPTDRSGRLQIEASDWGIAELRWSPNGEVLFSADENGVFAKWNWRTGQQLASASVGKRISQMILHPDGERILTWYKGSTLAVLGFDLEVQRRFDVDVTTCWEIDVLPGDESVVAACGIDGLMTIDLETGAIEVRVPPDGHVCRALALTPDRSELWLAWFHRMTGKAFLECWDLATWQRRLRVPSSTSIQRLKFASRDPDRFLAVGQNGELQMRRRDDCSIEFSRRVHTATTSALDVLPDGSRIATGSMDGTARIWFTPTATDVLVLEHGNDWVYCAEFHPQQRAIATAGEQGVIHVWLAEPVRSR